MNGAREGLRNDTVGVILLVPGSARGADFATIVLIEKPTEPCIDRVAALRIDDRGNFRKAPAVNAFVHINHRRRA